MNPKSFWKRASLPMKGLLSVALLLGTVITAATSASTSVIDTKGLSSLRMVGIVSDSMCGIAHGKKTDGDAECTRLCVKLGAQYALAAGKKVYYLQGRYAELDKLAGERVIVKGRYFGRDTISVESVTPLDTNSWKMILTEALFER